MKEIIISKDTPRDKNVFDSMSISKGIEKNYFLAVGLLFLGLMCIGAIFLPPYELGLTIFQAMIGVILIITGLIIVLINNKKVKSRKYALLNGMLIEGIIINHGRKFNPTSSTKSYSVDILYTDNNKECTTTITVKNKKAQEELPLQSKTLGILTNLPKYKVFFPAEIGVNLIVKE